MAIRTGKPSDKMLLQETLSRILKSGTLSLQDFIQQCEARNIYLLFNQASTGRISGITYFHDSFKAKGQALGNQFKWSEIIKQVDYEQDRDSEAISHANSRTLGKYGDFAKARDTGGSGTGISELSRSGAKNIEPIRREQSFADETGGADRSDRKGAFEANAADDNISADSNGYRNDWFDGSLDVQISDDIDDEAIHGRNRHRQKQARTNRR